MDDMVFGRRYRVTETIGSGGMAEVYKAVDETLGRTVAVKVMHPHYASDPEFVSRFRQEAASAANLQHPGIVNIYDFGVEGDRPYIVMELVRGTDLKTILRQRGPIDPVEVAEYGAQVCSALAVAHGYGIVHRDIKPHNIVLMPDGRVKVMDFGIARAVDSDSTQTGSVLGTAQYVSPEQAQGRPLSGQTDLYSLGVVLYELSTGHLPFDGDTPVAVALKHVNEAVVPPRRLNPSIPAALETVILKAMEKDTTRRYHSADEMREDLLRVASGQHVAAPPRADDTRVMPAVATTPAAARAAEARRAPQKRAPNPWPWVGLVAILLLVAVGGAWALGAFTPGIKVPDTQGLTLEQAKAKITTVGLIVGRQDSKPDETVPADQVISTDPAAGTAVKKGQVVDIVYSSGPPLVAVPPVVGMARAAAITALESAGFVVDPSIVETFSSKPPDSVISQDPNPGMAPKGSRVKLVVSKGLEKVAVPYVLEQTESSANTELKKAGFKVKTVSRYNDTVAVGVVYDQSPKSGTAVKGSTVTITVSLGPEKVTVPPLKDLDKDVAKAQIEALGLVADVQNITDPDPAHTGKVQNQDPAAGTKVNKGATVTIYIGTP